MTSYGIMIDVEGENLPKLLSALGSNYPDTIATYVTGTDGVDSTPAELSAVASHTGLFRYDQSPELSTFAEGGADGADVERGAGTLTTALEACESREGRGWYSWVYVNSSNLPEAREEMKSKGLSRVQFGVANWSLSQAEAIQYLAANDDVSYVQWASPSTNPNSICPGTRQTLKTLNVDLNVTRPGWFVRNSGSSGGSSSPARKSGLVITSDLETLRVSSTDGKNWSA